MKLKQLYTIVAGAMLTASVAAHAASWQSGNTIEMSRTIVSDVKVSVVDESPTEQLKTSITDGTLIFKASLQNNGDTAIDADNSGIQIDAANRGEGDNITANSDNGDKIQMVANIGDRWKWRGWIAKYQGELAGGGSSDAFELKSTGDQTVKAGVYKTTLHAMQWLD
ncbi:TPA: hypothetical protein IGZ69_003494 [Escherichia coli]|nr:hypothetical protein [Escherichia coli]HBC0974487.1 hypothetical protein [Escherichia coli]